MFTLMKTGQRIAFLRKERGLTGEKLAERLNVSPQAISKWENGKCLPETALLPELARALGCSIDSLLVPGVLEDVIEMQIPCNLNTIPDELIATALKGASPQLREHIFAYMPEERMKTINDDMNSQGPVRVSEVEAAQEKVFSMIAESQTGDTVNH